MEYRAVRRRVNARIARAAIRAVESLEPRIVMTGEPQVVGGQFLFETSPHRLEIQFDQDVSSSLAPADLYVHKYGTDATRLASSGFVLNSYDHSTNKATFRYTGNSGLFADGHYRLTLYKEDVTNAAAQPLASSWSLDFSFIYGDVNRDLSTDTNDLRYISNALNAQSNTSLPNATLTQGDRNYDTTVDRFDLDEASDSDLYYALPQLDKFGTSFTVFRRQDGTRELHWVDDCAFEAGYRIQYSTNGRSFSTLVNQTSPGVTSFLDTENDPSATVFYRIRAILLPALAASHVSGYGEPRSESSGNALALPGVITTSAIATNHVTVFWAASPGATQYEIWSARSGRPLMRTATIDATQTSFQLADLYSGQTYSVQVRANSAVGTSQFRQGTFTTLTGRPSLIRADSGINPDQLPFRFALQFDQPVFEAAPGALAAFNARLSDLRDDRVMTITSIAIDTTDRSIVWITSSQAPSADYNFAGAWPEGFYELILNEGVLKNAAGQFPGDPLDPSDVQGDESVAHGVFMVADLNFDGIVDPLDLAILTANYGVQGAGYSRGDINRDGTVGFADLVTLGQRYGLSIARPPETPGQLIASVPADTGVDSRHTIDLQWVAPANTTFNGFDIFRGTDGINFTKIDRVAADSRSYRDADLWEGKRYYYRVRSFVTGTGGSTTYSFSTGRESAKTVLSMPTDLHVREIGPGRVWLEWDDVAETETMYRAERTTTPTDGESWSPVGTGLFQAGAEWAEDWDVQPGIRYYYRVRALNNQTESATAIAYFNSELPAADSFSVVAVSASKVVVSWDYASADEGLIDGFVVHRSVDGGEYEIAAELDSTTRRFEDVRTLGSSSVASYRVVATRLSAIDSVLDFSGTTRTIDIDNEQILSIASNGSATSVEGDQYLLGVDVLNESTGLLPDHWLVNWGDNTDSDGDGIVGEIISGDLRTARHVYVDNGAYLISVTAPFTSLGVSAVAPTRSVTVSNVAPTLSVRCAETAISEEPYQLEFSASDPGADTIVEWRVNWGDGSGEQTYAGDVTGAQYTFSDTIDSAQIVVTAVDEDGTYTSTALSVSLDPLTPAPTSFVVISSTSLRIEWTRRSARATGYVIDASPDPEFTYDLEHIVVGANADDVQIDGLTPDTGYYVRVGVKKGATTRFTNDTILASTPPALANAPTDLSVEQVTANSASLSWSITSQTTKSSFIVERSDNGGSTWIPIATTSPGQSSFIDTAADEGLTFKYRLRATNGFETSSAGNVVTATTLTLAPEGFGIEPTGPFGVSLSWRDASVAESGFRIERSTSEDGTYTHVGNASANATGLAASALVPSTTYFFRIFSVNSQGAYSDPIVRSVTTQPDGTLPDRAVLNPADKSGLPSSIALSWTAATNAALYRVLRSDDSDDSWAEIDVVAGLSTIDVSIEANRTYLYRVVSVSEDEVEAEPSNEISATSSLATPTAMSTVTTDSSTATLSWMDNSPNEQWFTLWQFDTETGAGEVIATIGAQAGVGTVTYAVPLEPGVRKWFAVTANTTDATTPMTGRTSAITTRRFIDVASDREAVLSDAIANFDFTAEGINGMLTWRIDWGDGSPQQVVTGGDLLDQSHVFPTLEAGSEDRNYYVQATATSSDGTEYTTPAQSIAVVAAVTATSQQKWTEVATRRAILEKFNEIYNTVEYEAYAGVMKGADATRQTKRGNDWDQALLLQQEIGKILTAAGRPNEVTSRIRFDVIEANWTDVQRVLGVADAESANYVLKWTSALADQLDGKWKVRAGLADDDVPAVTLWHASLQVEGLGFKSGGLRLDASWKYRELRADNPLFPASGPRIGASSATQFNELAYFDQASLQSPLEWYENRLLSVIHKAGGSNFGLRGKVSLADAVYAGPILPRNFITEDVRTSNVPYSAIAEPGSGGMAYTLKTSGKAPVDNVDAVLLNNGDSTSLNMNHRLRLEVKRKNDNVVLINHTWNSAASSTGVISVGWEGSGNALTPKLYIGGESSSISGNNETANVGDEVKVNVVAIAPGQSPPAYDPNLARTLKVGQPFGLVTQAFAHSAASVAVHERRLAESASAILADDVVVSNERSAVELYQRRLLAVLAARYSNEAFIQQSAFLDLGNLIRTPTHVGWGYVTGTYLGDNVASTTSVYQHLQSPIFFKNGAAQVGFDLVGMGGEIYGRFNSVRADNPNDEAYRTAFRGANVALSSLESSVLEEVLGFEALSTTKGLQIVGTKRMNGVKILKDSDDYEDWKNEFNAADTTPGSAAYERWIYMKQQIGAAMQYDPPIWRITAPLAVPSIGTSGSDASYYGAWFQEPIEFRSDRGFGAYIYDGVVKKGGAGTNANLRPNTAPLKPVANLSNLFRGDPVQQTTGVLYQDETLVSLSSPGLPLGFQVHYDTRFSLDEHAGKPGYNVQDYDIGLGIGWSHNFSDRLVINTAGDIDWITSTGQTLTFKKLPNGYQNPAGKFGTMTKQGNGFLRYTETDRSSTTFDTQNRLDAIADSVGNQIRIRYQPNAPKVIGSATYRMADGNRKRELLFELDGDAKHIRGVSDDTGRRWSVDTGTGNTRYLKQISLMSSSTSDVAVGDHYDTVYDYYPDAHRAGMLKTITRKIGSAVVGTQKYDYYANGRALSTTNANDFTEYFSYDTFVSGEVKPSSGKRAELASTRTRHTDFNGNATTTLFNDLGDVSATIHDDRARVSQFWYHYAPAIGTGAELDGRALLKATTDEVGLSTLYSYGPNAALSENSRGMPTIIVNGSGADPAVPATMTSDGIVTKVEYSSSFWKPTKTITGDRVIENKYDPLTGLLEWTRSTYASIEPNGVSKDRTALTKYAYVTWSDGPTQKNLSLLAKKTLPASNFIEYAYDTAGQLREQKYSDNRQTITTMYDMRGNLVDLRKGTATDYKERIQHQYDALDRLRKTLVDVDLDGSSLFGLRDAADIITTINYQRVDGFDENGVAHNYLRQTTLGEGESASASDKLRNARSSQSVVYDAQDQVIETSRDSLATTKVINRYDGQGNLVKSIAADGKRVTQALFDHRGRARGTLLSGGGLGWQSYDGASRAIESNTATGTFHGYAAVTSSRTTREYYGSGKGRAGQLRVLTGPDGAPIKYDYNGFGEVVLTTIYRTDASTTVYESIRTRYDGMGRPIETRSTNNGVTSTAYDLNGNVIVSSAFDVKNVANYAAANDANNTFTAPLENFAPATRRDTAIRYDQADRPYAVRDAAGFVSLTEYDAAGRVSATYDARAADDDYTMAEFRDPTRTHVEDFLERNTNGTTKRSFQTRFEYDGAGRLTTQYIPDADADPTNDAKTQFTYYADGRLRTSSDRANNTTSYRYDRRNDAGPGNYFSSAGVSGVPDIGDVTDVTIVIDAAGQKTVAGVNAFGNAVYTLDVHGGKTLGTYDSMGRVVRQTSPAAGVSVSNQALVEIYGYDLAGNRVWIADDTVSNTSPRGGTVITYDTANRPTGTKSGERGSNPMSLTGQIRETKTAYANGHVSTETDPRGVETAYTHSFNGTGAAGMHTVVTAVAGVNRSSEPYDSQRYDSLGQLVESRAFASANDPVANGGRLTLYSYDLMGRPTQVRTPRSDKAGEASTTSVTKTVYDEVGNPIHQISADGVAWLNVPTNPPRTIGQVTGMHLGTTSTQFDAENRPTITTLPDPDNTVDANGILTIGTKSAPTSTTVYSSNFSGGRYRTTVTDALNNVTTTERDALGRVLKESTKVFISAAEPSRDVTRTFNYQLATGYTESTDRNGRRIRTNFDDLGRAVSEQWYDADQTYAAELTYGYDQQGRLQWAKTVDKQNAGASSQEDFRYTYDALGNVATYNEFATTNLPSPIDVIRAAVSHAYGYDPAGNVTSDQTAINGVYDNKLTYGYDPLGALAWTHQDAGLKFSKTVVNVNNAQGEVVSQARGLKGTFAGAWSGVENNNYLDVEIARDGAGRITKKGADWGDGNFEQYTYDRENRISTWRSTAGNKFDPPGPVGLIDLPGETFDFRRFTYDGAGQLAGVTPIVTSDGFTLDQVPQSGATYAFDANGNRTSAAAATAGKDNRVQEDDLYRYEYDGEGNTLKRVVKSAPAGGTAASYAYDHRNRLITATVSAVSGAARVTHLAYDAADRRVAKHSKKGSLAWARTNYSNSGDDPVLIFDVHPTTNAISLAERHLFGPAAAEIIASDDVKRGLVTWYHTDHEGSVKRTTVNGIQRTWQGYDAFGGSLGSPRPINDDASPALQFDAFKKEGARLGSSQAMAAPHYGNAWTTDAPNATQLWQIGVGQKARPAAGSAAPGNLNPAGRALVDLGELDGSVTATLSENVADPVQPNGSTGTLDGYATGLAARGGAVTLWIETPTASEAAQPGRGVKARKFRIIDAENNVRTLTFDPAAAAVSTAVSGTNDLEGWTRLGDKVMLTLAGTRAEVWVNDTKVATATLGATSASSTLPTTWGLTFRTGSSAGAIPAGRKLDGWDNFSLRATLPQTRFGYTGAEWDPETGLYHLGPRLYDPKTGRFLQQDPNPPTFEDARNPYRYAWGDPVNYTDPSGMSAFRSAGSAIGSAFGRVGAAVGGAIGGMFDSRKPAAASSNYAVSVNAGVSTQDYVNLANSSLTPTFGTNFGVTPVAGISASGVLSVGRRSDYALGTGPLDLSAGPIPGGGQTIGSNNWWLDAGWSFGVGTAQTFGPLISPTFSVGLNAYDRDQAPGSDYHANTSNWRQDVGWEGAVPVYGQVKQGTYDFSWAAQDWRDGDYLSAGLQGVTGVANYVGAATDLATGASILKSLGRGGIKFAGRGAVSMEKVAAETAAAENAAVRTNAQLVEEIGARADAWGTRQGLTGTAREIGTAKHTYARDLLNRYQSMYGDRGLVTERSFLNGTRVPYGTSGSVRLDVFDINSKAVWDYKFGVTPMSAAQRAKIMMQGPVGIPSVTAVHP